MAHVRHVLFASDFSKASRKAFTTAIAMAKANRATLTILHVIVPFAPIVPEQYLNAQTWEQLDSEARRWSQQQLRKLTAKAQTQTISGADQIADLTVNLGSGNNTIVVRGLDALFQGSLTVNGGPRADSIALEGKTSSGAYAFDGGEGDNSIVGAPGERNTWSITEVDAGTLGVGTIGSISFSRTQNITQGTVRDAFAFGPRARSRAPSPARGLSTSVSVTASASAAPARSPARPGTSRSPTRRR